MALSEFAARRAKPKEKAYKLFDGDGLYLLVNPTGSKLWRLKYRYGGKEKLLSFGPYPLIPIVDARLKRDEAKRKLLSGTDPSEAKRQEKLTAEVEARNTFGLIAAEYLGNLEARNRSPITVEKNRWLLEDLASPLSARPIKEITAAEILDLLKKIEKSGRRVTAGRLRGVIGSVFRLAVMTLRAEHDPTAVLKGALLPPVTQSRAAITDERELGMLLLAIDEYDGWPTISGALKFLTLTCVRPGEVRFAVRSEFDREKATWSIPAERMKMRQPHIVPLSRQALAILDDIWPLSEGGELVFPSVRSRRKPLSENALNQALRRMGYTKEEMTSHGCRASASSILNDRGFDPDVIEAVLAHQDANAVRRAYNRATYWNQRVKLMQEWADLLDEFRTYK